MKHKVDAILLAEQIMKEHRDNGIVDMDVVKATSVTIRNVLSMLYNGHGNHSKYVRSLNYINHILRIKKGDKFVHKGGEIYYDLHNNPLNEVDEIVFVNSDSQTYINRGNGVQLVWKKHDILIKDASGAHYNHKDLIIETNPKHTFSNIYKEENK